MELSGNSSPSVGGPTSSVPQEVPSSTSVSSTSSQSSQVSSASISETRFPSANTSATDSQGSVHSIPTQTQLNTSTAIRSAEPASDAASLPAISSSASSTAPSAGSATPSRAGPPGRSSSGSQARTRDIGAGVGGAGAVLCLVLALLGWRYKRRIAKRRRLRSHTDDDEEIDGDTAGRESGAPLVPEFVDRYGERTVAADREKSVVWEEGAARATDTPGDDPAPPVADRTSNGTTLVSDSATVGGPHPPSYETTSPPPPQSLPLLPPLPPVPPQSPPPAFFAQRRQAADGGVRLPGRGLALGRVHTAAASSVDSLSTLPPPYEPHV